MPANNLFRLLQLTDLTLPIGGFAHSAGLETYVQLQIVRDLVSAGDFIVSMLRYNIRFTDGAFVSLAFQAAEANDWEQVASLDRECTAVKLAAEIRKSSRQLGLRLLKIFRPVCKNELVELYSRAIEARDLSGNYPVAFGLVAAALQVEKADALSGFYYNVAAGMVTNCVKLVPLGQQDGQELLFSLQPLLQELVTASLTPDWNKIGICCPGFDIRCMQHERLYSRLYMS